ncbi:MAG: PD-(D/E)XK nuclease family protein [Candidatus Cloacimonadota bacterium]|nr:MAG: PD-(D/E)XK nuclease family protein [Candidatus Cloacimonadota bacterium]
MKKIKVYKLKIEHQDKEFYLLKRLFEEHPASDSPFENTMGALKVIYVANSSDKIRRIKEFIRNEKGGSFTPRLVTIGPLFEFLYEILPPEERLTQHLIKDAYAKVILRYLLINRRKELFPSSGFSLSPEASDFFLQWIKNIKEYNLHLTYEKGKVEYRPDASPFDLTSKVNRFNESLLFSLGKVFKLYEQFLKDNNLVDISDKRWWVIDHIKPSLLKEYSFFIEHLSILRGIEQKLFIKIYKEAKDVSTLDFFYSFPGTQFTTTGIIRGETEEIEVGNIGGEVTPEIRLRKYEKKENEVDAIARIIVEADVKKKIIIVSPEIDEYEKIFERIFPRYLIHPPSLSSRKLFEFPVIKTCLAIFEIINQHLRRRAVVSFLLSPFIKLLNEKERRRIDSITRKEMIVSGDDWKRIKNRAIEMRKISNFIEELKILKSKKGKAFIEKYLSLLDSLLRLKDEIEIKPYNKFLEYILSLTREPVVKIISEFGIKDFQRIFLSYTEAVNLSTTREVDERIEILDMEETGGMNFDIVFLIGLVEGKLPKEPQYNPLFSEKLLGEMGFPTYDMLYTLSKFNFESVMGSAKKVFCSFYNKDEKGNVFLRSPFLQDMNSEKEVGKENKVHTLLEWQLRIGEFIHQGEEINEAFLFNDMKKRALYIRDGIKRLRDGKRLRDVKGFLLSSKYFQEYVKKRINGLSKGLSAFALETYKRCPYNFLLSYILGLGELEEPEEGLDNLIRGKVIHEILASFFRRRLAKKIEENLTNDWEEMREMALDTIENRVPGVRDRILLRLELTSKDYKSLLKRFLDYEVRKNKGNTVKDVEWRFTGKDVHFKCDGQNLGLAGRIDRIDKNSDGIIIFDYKTGSKKNLPSARSIENGESFQFPFYHFAVEKSIGKVAKTVYYVINSKEGILTEEKKIIPQELFISNVISVWREIKELNFEPEVKSDCTKRCPFNELCPETT